MQYRKGDSAQPIPIMGAIIIAVILILLLVGFTSGAIKNPLKVIDRTMATTKSECQPICYKCCKGMEGLSPEQCENPPIFKPEIASCHCPPCDKEGGVTENDISTGDSNNEVKIVPNPFTGGSSYKTQWAEGTTDTVSVSRERGREGEADNLLLEIREVKGQTTIENLQVKINPDDATYGWTQFRTTNLPTDRIGDINLYVYDMREDVKELCIELGTGVTLNSLSDDCNEEGEFKADCESTNEVPITTGVTCRFAEGRYIIKAKPSPTINSIVAKEWFNKSLIPEIPGGQVPSIGDGGTPIAPKYKFMLDPENLEQDGMRCVKPNNEFTTFRFQAVYEDYSMTEKLYRTVGFYNVDENYNDGDCNPVGAVYRLDYDATGKLVLQGEAKRAMTCGTCILEIEYYLEKGTQKIGVNRKSGDNFESECDAETFFNPDCNSCCKEGKTCTNIIDLCKNDINAATGAVEDDCCKNLASCKDFIDQALPSFPEGYTKMAVCNECILTETPSPSCTPTYQCTKEREYTQEYNIGLSNECNGV